MNHFIQNIYNLVHRLEYQSLMQIQKNYYFYSNFQLDDLCLVLTETVEGFWESGEQYSKITRYNIYFKKAKEHIST